ncbi:MAG: FkbM family methyltransferase [Spartobacteria bacterium]|nr:FkbM family methyltransferase [Spartobacteria bacterium]
MLTFLNKLARFDNRCKRLRRITGGYLPAASSLITCRLNRRKTVSGKYISLPFRFRGIDENALHEVLIDNEYGFLDEMLRETPAPLVADIGGHIGLFAIHCFAVNAKSRVRSLEASPGTFKILQKNAVQLAKTKGLDWRAFNRAAWKDDTIIHFDDSGVSMSHRVSALGSTEVSGMTLADFMTTVMHGQTVDVMKIDIEGAEESFLCENAEPLRNVRRLVIELHPNLCDTARVETIVKAAFPKVCLIGARTSSKPLLDCRK